MSRIRVTIDQVVFRGMEAIEARALVGGLKSQLAWMLADPTNRAAWARSQRTPVLRLGRLPMDPGPLGGRKFGGGLARAIGKGLKP
jgi:hypothetical protein